MKYFSLILAIIALSGCANNLRAPFSVEDPTVYGEKNIARGSMIKTSKDRYWASYCNALETSGYKVLYQKPEGKDENDLEGCRLIGRVDGYTAMRVIKAETKSDIFTINKANIQFWKDGKAFARTLCSDFFRRIARSYAHRQHARMQTNVAGGFLTGVMGLFDASSGVTGGTALAFASAESAFNNYDESYLITPNLGLMEALVKTTQREISREVDSHQNKLKSVSDVITHINEYVYPCTYTGMQALLDESLNRKLTEFSQSDQLEGFKRNADHIK
jgi:hypothetical protein